MVLNLVQVVRSAVTSGAGSTTSGVVSGSLGSREINYILRVLGPASCRNPECFAETANSCIRIALPAPRGAGTGNPDDRIVFTWVPDLEALGLGFGVSFDLTRNRLKTL